MNPDLSPEARNACLYVMERGFIAIRAAVRAGDSKRAEAIAAVLHNLPRLVREGNRFGWTIREFRRLFLADNHDFAEFADWDRRLQPFD